MQTCSECRTEKPLDDYYDRVKWQGGKHKWCKECMLYDRWVRKVLATSHPKEDNQACYLCGDTTRRLEVEHSHTRAKNDPRDAWNGWACHPCNLRKRRKLGNSSSQGLEEGVGQAPASDVLQMK